MGRILIVPTVVVLALGAVRAGQAQEQDDPNLIGWWKLDEGFGAVAVDSSGKGHDGRFVGEPLWVDGFSGTALEFDGVDDYVLCAERSGTNPGVYPKELMPAGGFTVACWVKLHQFAYFSSFVGNGLDTGDDECGFFLYNYGWVGESGRDFGLAIRTETAMNYVETPNIYETGTWYHLAATYDGRNVIIYVNGAVSAGPQSVGGPIRWISRASGNYPERFAIGVWLDPGYDLWVDGVIDDVRYYNRVLPDAEIKRLAFRPKAHNPDPPDGAAGVTMPLLKWTAGTSAQFHNVYLGTGPELGPATLVGARLPFTMYYHVPGLQPGVTYCWRVDEIETDGVTTYTGDVWTFTAQALTAYSPTPADGVNDAAPTPVLTWLPGQAAVKHHVYFSDALDAVQQRAGDADRGEVADATFSPGALADATTYYWAVDELIVGGTTKAGPVWTFTTYLRVDDFESYADDEGSRIYETWADGLTNGTGSLVGYMTAPFAEQAVVHGGLQSMPLDYNNVNAPFYSEAECDFATAQDWTVGDLTTLVVFVRGRSGNGPAPLYLTVTDGSNHTATVVYPDAAVVGAARWTEWKIPLDTLTGVNPARVKGIVIGLGDKANPAAGGAGRIYVDDIRVTK
jgi:hypothetical protein